MSRIGLSPTGMSGLGRIVVYGASRVPRPPARMTAFMMIPSALYLVSGWIVAVEVLRDPFDRAAQPFVQPNLRLPAQQLARQAIVAVQLEHLAAGRADARSVGF